MADFITTICDFGKAQEDRESFDKWLEMADVLAFLKENAMTTEFVLYATGPHTFMHSVLVPNERLSPPDVEDLMCWNCNASSTWGIWTRRSRCRDCLSSSGKSVAQRSPCAAL
jgi:hypothetical protein